jgi:large subunit ribosomal protein L5
MRLKEKYQKEITKALKEKFGYKNVSQIPRLEKVVLNVGFGKKAKEKESTESVEKTLRLITGQKPVLTKAKISISAFKIREGMIIGAMVTLRGQRMYDFMEKLINITFPRVRDFRGLNEKGMDRTGNYTIGFKENSPFPEIKVEDLNNIHGLEVIVKTTAKNREEGLELLTLLGLPFKKN